jgi:hypothetical protein
MASLCAALFCGTPTSVSDLVVQTRSAIGVLVTSAEAASVFFEEVFQQ